MHVAFYSEIPYNHYSFFPIKMEETGASIETFINHATQEQEGLAFWDEILNVVQN